MKKRFSHAASFLIIILLFFSPIFSGYHPDGIKIDWTHYHNYAETTAILNDFSQRHKDLCRLYSIGQSFQGKEIWCMEITDYATGAPETKPDASAAVAQPCGDTVDRDQDPALGLLVGLACAPAPQELDLEVVERRDIGEAVRDGARQRRIVGKPAGLLHDAVQRRHG